MRSESSRIGDSAARHPAARLRLATSGRIVLATTIAGILGVPAYAQTEPPRPTTTLPSDLNRSGPSAGGDGGDRSLAQMQEQAALGRSISRATQSNRARAVSVMERPRPRYDAQGIMAGGFRVLPVASIDALADSNVFRTANPRGDVSVEPSLQVTARSVWSRHALNLAGNFTNYSYATYKSEDANVYSASANGRIDVVGRSFLTLGVERAHDILSRGAIGGVPVTTTPIRFDRTAYTAAGSYVGAIVSLSASGGINKEHYFNAIGPIGAVVDQQYRNVTIARLGGSVDYYLRPRTSIFTSVTLERRRYRVVPGSFIRDSNAVTAVLGVRGEITPVIRGTLGFGALHQEFKDPQIKSTTGFTFDGDLEWLVTTLTTIKFVARRSVASSVNVRTPVQVLTTLSVGADHEFLRNVTASAQITRQFATFPGIGPKDSRWRTSVGAQWLIDNRISVRGDVGGEFRRTQISNTDPFDRVTARLGLTYRL